MRKNEYTSLEEFTSQYCGIRHPAEDKWFGLKFSWNGKEYRLHTGLMYADEPSILPDGSEVLFGLYEKVLAPDADFRLIQQFPSMDALLESRCIEGRRFAEIIMDDDTELLGQD